MKTSKIGWRYVLDAGYGTTGEAYHSTLNNNAFSIPERLAREALQNSRDAVRKGQKLEATFRFLSLDGPKKKSLVDALALADLSTRSAFFALNKPNCLEGLQSPKPIRALVVEDFGTTGLFGNPAFRKSHLRRLLLVLGDRGKTREGDHTGGSYGFGKAVYSVSSRIRTIVAYSRFDENADGGVSARLLGCGYFRAYETKDGSEFNGLSVFGRLEDGEAIAKPLENEAAHQAAKALGFAPRKSGQSGTSILILDPHPDLNAASLVAGIETWWWPALADHAIDVSVYDEAGKRYVPRAKRKDLQPFVEAYQIATGVAHPIPKVQTKSNFQKMDQIYLGDAGAVLIDESQLAHTPPEDRESKVALIRGPRMVVQYLKVGAQYPIVAGAYVASEEIDQWLRTSEDPAHQVWDHTSPDLEQHGDLSRLVVSAIPPRLKSFVAKFRKEVAPPPEAAKRALRTFEQALGRAFKEKGVAPPPPPNGRITAPVNINFTKQPTLEALDSTGELIKFTSRFHLKLREDFQGNSGHLKLRLNCDIVEDRSGLGDELPLAVAIKGGLLTRDESEERGMYVGLINKEQKLELTVESLPYERGWTVRFQPSIEFEKVS
jgi:hypothetical protein